MTRDVFNRYEQKYLINEQQKQELCQLLSRKMLPDSCNTGGRTYPITNIYCDDTDFSLIRQSLSRPQYKEKLRLRSYGIAKPDDQIYIEIKKKYQGKVNKRRTKIQLQDALRLLQTRGRAIPKSDYCDLFVIEEICSMLSRFELKPAWFIAYDRLAYTAADSSGLRISFDRNIRWRSDQLDLTAGDSGKQLISPDQWLLEIKTPLSIPIWLTDHLTACKVYPSRFSKYGKSFQIAFHDNKYKGVESQCSVQYSQLTAPVLPIVSHQHS